MAAFIESATRALGLGYSVFPVSVFQDERGKRQKIPLVKWSEYSRRKPNVAELKQWSDLWPWAGIGIPTGGGLAVIDIDRKDDRPLDATRVMQAFDWYQPEEWPAFCQTAGGGMHLYARASGPVANAVALAEADGMAIDIRGDGGYVVGPGSTLWSCDMREPVGGAHALGSYDGHLERKEDLPGFPDGLRPAAKEPAYTKLLNHPVIPSGMKHGVMASSAMSWAAKVGALAGTAKGEKVWLDFVSKRIVGRDITNDHDERLKAMDALNSALGKQCKEVGFYTVALKQQLKEAQTEALADQQFDVDMAGWEFKVTRAIQIGDLVVMDVQLADARARVQVESKDFLNQDKFRAAFLTATGRVLPKIKPKSFDRFTLSFEIKKSEGLGIDLMDILKDELHKRLMQMADAEDEAEASEALQKKGMAKFMGKLLFRLPTLQMVSPALKTLKPTLLASALRDIGCSRVKFGEAGEVWEHAV